MTAESEDFDNMAKSFYAEGIHRFLIKKDRTINPFFVGRKDLQYRIDRKSKIISQKYMNDPGSNPAGGQTQVIQGPPGIGKTSLLEKIKQNCIEKLNDQTESYKIIPVMVSNPTRLSHDYLAGQIQKTIEELDRKITIAKVKDEVHGALRKISSVSAFGFGLGLDNSSEAKPVFPKKYCILLLIDEIQTIASETNPEVARVLLDLHLGSDGYPVFPVLAGLSNSEAVLQEKMASPRFGRGAVHQLQPLSLPEVKESLVKFIDYFNVRSTPELTSEWGDRIGRWVDGWPKHVENTLAALGQELQGTEGVLSAIDPIAVKHRATQYRVDYYNSRFGMFKSNPRIIGEIMAELGQRPRSKGEIGTIINSKRKDQLRVEEITHSELDKLTFDFLQRYGFLDRIPDDPTEFTCPIPSLQSYAVTWTGTPLHRLAYSGDLDSLGEKLELGHDINGRDAWGRTPLQIATENNWKELVSHMLAAGAKKSLPNNPAMERIVDKPPSNSGDYGNDFDPSPDF
ncbi:MAG: hypothetical protein F4203_03970 [Rhodobacteraceae bacterium]|nr:hypothetical protein [Paracoccaceae bacterium]